jgi:hypothetical protein
VTRRRTLISADPGAAGPRHVRLPATNSLPLGDVSWGRREPWLRCGSRPLAGDVRPSVSRWCMVSLGTERARSETETASDPRLRRSEAASHGGGGGI